MKQIVSFKVIAKEVLWGHLGAHPCNSFNTPPVSCSSTSIWSKTLHGIRIYINVSLVEIGPSVLVKKMSMYFRYFGNCLPLKKRVVLYLNELEIPFTYADQRFHFNQIVLFVKSFFDHSSQGRMQFSKEGWMKEASQGLK